MEALKFIHYYINNFKRYRDKWNYEDGCVLKGVIDLYKATEDKRYLDFVIREMEKMLSSDGEILNYQLEEFNIDNINSGKVLQELYCLTRNEKYKLGIQTLKKQLEQHPRTNEGNFWHKKIYPYQVWLDGLYMAMPFYAKNAVEDRDEEAIQDILKQFSNVEIRLKDTKTGLYYHGYDESKREKWCDPITGLSPNFWGRAMGWFVMALVDTIEILGNYPGTKKIREIFKDAVDSLLKYQDPEKHMWYQVIDKGGKEGNYLETSATLMISYGILKGVRLGLLPTNYQEHGIKAFEGTINQYLDGDKLDGICGVAGLGNTPYRDGSYEYYISEPIIPNDHKGVGAFIMAYSEYIKI